MIEKIVIGQEVIHLNKGMFGWNVVHPWKNEDGSYNWFNLITGGSWTNLFMWIFIAVIIVGVVYEYTSNINTLVSCFDNLINLENCKEAFGGSNLNWIR